MRNTMMTIAAGLFLSLSTAALADDPTPPAAQPVSATNDAKTIVCHTYVHQGMLVRKNETCKTKEQWDKDRRSEEHDIDTFQQRTYSAPFGK
jgi:hypothetical protein